MIPSLVQQITAAARPEPTCRANPRRERIENILMLMLGRNVSAADMARHYKKSLTALTEDLREIEAKGYAFSFRSSDGHYKRTLYSLTKSGILRAKQLKEMSDGQDVQAQH